MEEFREIGPAAGLEFEEAQELEVAAAAEGADALAPLADVAAEGPAGGDGPEVALADVAPAPDQDEAQECLRQQEEEVGNDQEQEQVLGVLENEQEAVAVGEETLGLAGARLDDAGLTLGIDRDGAAMVHPGGGDSDQPASGDLDAPAQVGFLGIHEEAAIETADAAKHLRADQDAAAGGGEEFDGFGGGFLVVGKAAPIQAGGTEALEVVVAIVQHEGHAAVGPGGKGPVVELLEAIGLEPSVVVEEEEELAGSAGGATVVAFAEAEIAPVGEEEGVGPGAKGLGGEAVGAIGGGIVGNDDLDGGEEGLSAEGVEAALEPGGAIVVENDDADLRGERGLAHDPRPRRSERLAAEQGGGGGGVAAGPEQLGGERDEGPEQAWTEAEEVVGTAQGFGTEEADHGVAARLHFSRFPPGEVALEVALIGMALR